MLVTHTVLSIFAILFLQSSTALAEWNLAVSCDEGALKIYRDEGNPERYKAEIGNSTINRHLEFHHATIASGNSNGYFQWASSVLRTFDNQEPLRIAEIYSAGPGVKVVVDTRSHKSEIWQWTDSTGYPRSAGCVVRLGRSCSGHGGQVSVREVEAYSRNWFFRTCDRF